MTRAPLFAAIVVALAACGSEPARLCANGMSCPKGTTCAAKQLACITGTCGDGVLDELEACDDGNIIDGDGCSATCQTLVGCGDGVIDAAKGELCDDGNTASGDGCRGDCRKVEACGDGVKDIGEVCDDGNAITDTTCPYGEASCVVCSSGCDAALARVGNVCGDGTVDLAHEDCDDGNTVTETSCAYGTATCTRCDAACRSIQVGGDVCGDQRRDPAHEACDDGNTTTEPSCPYGTEACEACDATCSTVLVLTGNVCGDHAVDLANEECDDGNTITESACPYGVPICSICAADCTLVPTAGNVCGDGVVDSANEACDDSNTSSCGTCSADCQTVTNRAATGFIAVVTATKIVDGETIVLDDGASPPVAFEYNLAGGVGPGNVAIALGAADSAAAVRTKTRIVINSIGALAITATDGPGNLVLLTDDRATSFGNAALVETVSDTDFAVSGMSGGQGGDCGSGVGCSGNTDCESGSCLGGLCQ